MWWWPQRNQKRDVEIPEAGAKNCTSQSKVSNLQLQDDGRSSWFDVFDLDNWNSDEDPIPPRNPKHFETLSFACLILFASPAHPLAHCACWWHPAPRSVCFRWSRHHPIEPGTPSSTDAQRRAPHWNDSSTSNRSRPMSLEVGIETARKQYEMQL